MSDFRVDSNFFDHLKVKKLKRELGAEGVCSLLTLWAYASKHRTDGDLSGMTSEDIEDISAWFGKSNQFSKCLTSFGFLNKSRGLTYKIHNWSKNNPYISKSKERSAIAKAAADARWGNKNNNLEKTCDNSPSMPLASNSNAPGMLLASNSNAPGILLASNSNAPSPSPSPSPNLRQEQRHYTSSLDVKKMIFEYLRLCPSGMLISKDTQNEVLTKKINEALNAHPFEWWTNVFARAEASEFLSGKTEGKEGNRFEIKFGWITKLDIAEKIASGFYDDNGKKAGKRAAKHNQGFRVDRDPNVEWDKMPVEDQAETEMPEWVTN